MSVMTTFSSDKEALFDMLRVVEDGKTQLPDFQRGWVWDDDHIKSLIASVSLSHPIGAVMLLHAGNPDVRFKPRLVEGVELGNPPEPERLILDGQQRLTSLFQSLFADKPVETRDARGKSIRRWYYIDMEKALNLDGDREETIIGLPEDKIVRNFRGEVVADYSRTELEYKAGLFPLCKISDYADWRAGHNEFWDYEKEKIKLFDHFEREILKRFEQYQVPPILLRKETPKEAICQVFEKVNTGGVSLTVFELLTATYAADNFNLREDWAARERELKKNKILGKIQSDDFLQAISLLATRARRLRHLANGQAVESAPAISCKRKDVLKLSLDEYRCWADSATDGLKKAAKLLFGQKLFAARDLPYRTQLTPLAAILATLDDQADKDGVRFKIVRWYWCGVFGELYGSAIETRFAKDLPEVVDWATGGPEPSTVNDANFIPTRLLTLRTRNSAAYKGLSAVLLRDGASDLLTGEPVDVQMYFEDRIDIHHIFPKDWCIKQGINRKRYDCIVNKTPLAAKTNRIIGANPPSIYLPRLERRAGVDNNRMDEMLASHVVHADSARLDDFDAFFGAREQTLLQRIEKAMGKPVMRERFALEEERIEDYSEEEEDEA